jgi:hypothetical protein
MPALETKCIATSPYCFTLHDAKRIWARCKPATSERSTMKSLILVVIAGALLGACSFHSDTTVQRPVAQPAAVVVADPAPTTTTTVYRN